MDIKEQILVALGLDKEVEVSMEWQAKTEDGTILTSTADELVAGVDVSVLTEDGTTIPLPIGTYKLDTGVSFTVEEEGIVAEVMETADWKGMEKRIENLEIAIASLKEDKVEATEEMAEEIIEPSSLPKTITTKEVKEFSIDDLKAENDKLKAELAAQPDSLALDTNKFSSNKPTLNKTNYNKLSRKDKFLYDLNN